MKFVQNYTDILLLARPFQVVQSCGTLELQFSNLYFKF
jgi:hypothetical protein